MRHVEILRRDDQTDGDPHDDYYRRAPHHHSHRSQNHGPDNAILKRITAADADADDSAAGVDDSAAGVDAGTTTYTSPANARNTVAANSQAAVHRNRNRCTFT